ncbi:synaptotagmin-like protein 2 isoform X2 [Antennarius striatus]|uniref:synaptotagmin-like protein 2 isoform X2 n=1 Tax=Antennarius striatus TaxID=241820 RepID=UPI0035B1BDE0
MIDLSHLTEEEQGMIMAVLMRDAQLKKAEEERISKLEKIQSSGIRLDSQLKYLTGEWFYEVKSRRHMDKIHGSEIILASMKQRKADGSLRSERSKTPSSQGSDIIAPPKPARSTEGLRSQDDYEREKENLNSGIRSPRTPRHNPFNKVSFIAVETPEYNNDMSPSQRQWPTEPEKISPLRSHAPREASQGSITSDASSSGFRPVPRKRTFLTKHTSSESESSLGVDASVLSAGVVPSPRQRLQRGSSGNSDLKGQNLTPQKAIVSTQMSLPPSKSLNEHSQQPLQYIPQALSNSSVEKESNPRLYARERPTTYTMRNEVTEREIPLNPYGNNGKTTRDYASPNSVTVQTVGLQRSERGEGEDLSLPQSTVGETDDEDHPVRKALKRAVARPKQLAKSLEDITSSVSPRQERRQTPNADTRHINNISAIPSSSPTLFSNPDHLKKISKSVPLLLDDEDIGRDTDSNWDNSYRTKSGLRDSFSNLTNSSSMASRSGSVMTMYSGDLSNVEVQGSLQFSINYIQKLKEFHIFVAECRDLAAVDLKRGRSDPYVKSYLIPDKANLGKRKTSVKKKTLNPTFNEILRYRVRMEYLKTKMLILSVWHHDTFGRNSFLGEVDLDLSKWNFSHTQMNYVALKGKTFQTTPSLQPSGSRGEMKLAIRFLPQSAQSEESAVESPNSGEVHIWVKECKNLPLIRTTIDPYVKCFVLPDTSRKSRQKTRVLQRTVDPAFNHTMVYDGIREADLVEACVELTVWDRDKLISHLLGGLRLGVGSGTSYGAMVDWMDSTPYEVKLWERMRASPNEWVEDVLPLRMLNSARTAIK